MSYAIRKDGQGWRAINGPDDVESNEIFSATKPDRQEQTHGQMREEAKRQRAAAVAAITVMTISGHTFDGDEDSQGRMARAIIGMEDAEVLPWVLADNTVVEVGKTELREALRLCGAAQSALWVIA